ncbi:MAG TPA: asparaginase [Dehalococcoidia bacterium]|nr:asparaginase [Dehalococcoidia bacterium]
MSTPAKPRVAMIGTGGSISIVGRNPYDLYEYGDFGEVLEVDELLARFPEVTAAADIVPKRFKALPSTSIEPEHWLALNDFVHEVAATEPGIAGIAITHGTATLEETAYFLNLTLKIDLPVVVVGAQRPPTGLSTDTPINLLNAAQVAGSPAARGLGVLVLLNNEIQAAREVTKTSTLRLETFRSPDLGMLGYADPDGRVAIYRAPTRRHAPDTIFDVRGRTDLPRVDITYSYGGADGTAIRAFVEAGAKAIVAAGMLPGMTTRAERHALLQARERGVVVIQSHRGESGRVIRRTKLQERGLIAADNLNPQKARVLAMLALTRTADPDEIQGYFDEY